MTQLPLWVAAGACLGCCGALGAYVRSRPPTPLDVAAFKLTGKGTKLAAAFTLLGRWYAILAIGSLAAIVARLAGANVRFVLAVLASQIVAQLAVSALKWFVRRSRPGHWIIRLEHDLSYPSGHAATSVIFFLPLALLALHAPGLSPPAAAAVALIPGVCVIGIPWSRLALGAHYATDVIGGLLFGGGWLCAALAIFYGVSARS
jgi:undecaprenyl-diphosphatase